MSAMQDATAPATDANKGNALVDQKPSHLNGTRKGHNLQKEKTKIFPPRARLKKFWGHHPRKKGKTVCRQSERKRGGPSGEIQIRSQENRRAGWDGGYGVKGGMGKRGF